MKKENKLEKKLGKIIPIFSRDSPEDLVELAKLYSNRKE